MARPNCQAVACPNPRTASQFMCKPHWFALPAPMRRAINATWRAYNAAAGERRSPAWLAYIEARDDARRWMANREGCSDAFEAEAPRIRALQAR